MKKTKDVEREVIIPEKKNLFIGLDVSLCNTGLCVLNVDGKITKSETVRPKDLRGGERLCFIRSNLYYWVSLSLSGGGMARNFFAQPIAVIEGYAYRGSGAIPGAEAGGVVQALLWENGIPFFFVPPSTLKKFATGSGRADKAGMRTALTPENNALLKTEHEVDAYWLARYALEKSV